MRILSAVLLVACLALVAPPGPDAAAREGEVEVTFRLTLYGEVPPRDGFELSPSYRVCDPVSGCYYFGDFTAIPLCGDPESLSFPPSQLPAQVTPREVPPCVGGGGVQEIEITEHRPRAKDLMYTFVRHSVTPTGNEVQEVILQGQQPLEGGFTVDAYYRYDDRGRPLGGGEGQGPGSGDGGRMPKLPRTGGGGSGGR